MIEHCLAWAMESVEKLRMPADPLPDLADIASIATAMVAVYAYGRFCWTKCRKRRALEEYLKSAPSKLTASDTGARTLTHLVRNLGMTEAEILDAAFGSKHIERLVGKDEQGYADGLLLKYSSTPPKP